MAAGVVHIPWYATVFRGDKFELAMHEIAPVAARYGATDYRVYRQRDDPYRFLQMATFEDPIEPRFRDIEHAAQISHIDKGGRHAAVSFAASFGAVSKR